MRIWIKNIRTKKELSIKAAAKMCGISRSYYEKIERGERNVPVPTAKAIAAALGFDWQRFYEVDREDTNADLTAPEPVK